MGVTRTVHVGSVPSLDFGSYLPDDTNTGFRVAQGGMPQVNYPGTSPLNITVDGTSYSGCEIFGDINIKADGVSITDNLLRGPRNWPTTDGAIIDCNSSLCFNAIVRHNTIVPQLPNYYRNAIIGHEYTYEYNRSIWVNDHAGMYSKPGLANATNVKVAGNYMTDNVYWQGTVAQYPGQVVGSLTVTPTYGAPLTVAGYPLKVDGTHNDGVQCQGALGAAKSVWIIGNNINNRDAVQAFGHPLGWSEQVPQLGTQNSPKRKTYQGTVSNPMLDGRFASNGQAIVIQQNTYQNPAVDTVVAELNWLNDYGQGANLQALAGGFTTMQCTFRNNRFGQNVYNFSGASNPSIYPIRIDSRAGATIAGLNTNVWFESHWGAVGSPLVEGRHTGIVYDS